MDALSRIEMKDTAQAGLWARDVTVTYRNGVTALRKASFAPFVVYRIVLSAVLLAVLAFS